MGSSRVKPLAFWGGCAAVTAGVLLHLPMFWMARHIGWRLADMPMDAGMVSGMGLILLGVAMTAYGLLPDRPLAGAATNLRMSPIEDAPLTPAHWRLMIVLTIALIVDVMKPASLGFVVPGMRAEYGLAKAAVAWLPFAALLGTFVGSLIWGVLADIYGRRATILLSSILFVGTSICGAMPSFAWNIGMCFMMGAAAGGLLPVAYALLAETMPSRHRGWALVIVGGLGAAGGHLAASALSALLQPLFGWRIMWFLNLPTGLLLIAMSGLLPESAKFLMSRGRFDEAMVVLASFGSILRPAGPDPAASAPAAGTGLVLNSVILSVVGLTWSGINFGLLLWLPADLVARGYSIGLTSKLLAQSAAIALPMVFLAALLYSRWSSKGALAAMIGVSAAGALGLILLDLPGFSDIGPVIPITLLIFGSTGLLAVLMPYSSELFPLRVRGRANGLIAGSTKFGGLIAQGASLLAIAPSIAGAEWFLVAALTLSVGLITLFGEETRGRDLRTLDAQIPMAAE
ncbi:putative MFS transporter [Caulobacter ginsengisoli]|uniref:MFS transporter n=1 Tax=Caulobacter ginsengisoli TaxID=400775 RepID=A0ABU0IQP6_9CAUL|nr:MFS transporter [Caulobacter ginsengisoli]MDQ0464333.1 putative MFS transporter [Caulobacter ginsengisoli]